MVCIAEIYQDEIKISQDGSCPRDDRKHLSRTVCSLGFFSKVVHANVCKFCCLCKVGDPLATSRFAPMAAYLAIFRPCVRGGLASVSVFPGLKCRLILYCLGVNIGNWYNNTPQHRSQTQHWSVLEGAMFIKAITRRQQPNSVTADDICR